MQTPVCSRVGESKESVDQYTVQHVQSGVSSRKRRPAETQNKTKPNHKTQKKQKNKKQQTKKSPRSGGRALRKKGSLCADELKSNWILLKATAQPTRHHSKIAVEGAKKKQEPISSAETQDPPSQDPGDYTKRI